MVVIGGIKGKNIEQAIEWTKATQENNELTVLVPEYIDTNITGKAIKITQIDVKILDKFTWRKDFG